MAKTRKESFFWTSYSDLMTSMFFVMLVLFVLTISMLHYKMVKTAKERDATAAQLEKIQRLEKSIEKIDPDYF
jgi:heme/copper-type cytochrome/quinol oxidase subunit 2